MFSIFEFQPPNFLDFEINIRDSLGPYFEMIQCQLLDLDVYTVSFSLM